MVITNLVENKTISKEYVSKHGLCLHIKTRNKSILFDLGPDDTFIKNANNLNISIADVDIVIISHGHKDHGGGLRSFLNYNKKAKIYINENAFDDYYVSILGIFKYHVGLDRTLKDDNRIVLVKDIFEINNDIKLFSNITDNWMVPKFNKGLLMKDGNEYIQDKFKHEQNLILKENNKHVLVAGCAHNGIINIMKKAEGLIGVKIDVVLSGMHLYNPVLKINESTLFIESLGRCLLSMECRIYTFHCTGIKAFNILRGIIGDNIEYLATGQGAEI